MSEMIYLEFHLVELQYSILCVMQCECEAHKD